MPTSLTHIILLDQRLLTLDTCCGYLGTIWHKHGFDTLTQIFTGQPQYTECNHRMNRDAFRCYPPFLQIICFKGINHSLTEKRQLSAGPGLTSLSSMMCVTASLELLESNSRLLVTRYSGNIYPFPFRDGSVKVHHKCKLVPNCHNNARLSPRLSGSTNP